MGGFCFLFSVFCVSFLPSSLEKTDLYCQVPHLKHYMVKRRDAIAYYCPTETRPQSQPVHRALPGLHEKLPYTSECVYSIYTMSGGELFPGCVDVLQDQEQAIETEQETEGEGERKREEERGKDVEKNMVEDGTVDIAEREQEKQQEKEGEHSVASWWPGLGPYANPVTIAR